MYGTRVITFKSPCSFFIPTVNSATMRGITKLTDFGNNLEFRNATDSSGSIKPGLFNWNNLQVLDLHGRTSVPGLTQANYFDTNTNLQQIIIPKALEQNFRSDSRWSKYQDKFIIK